MSDVEQLQGPVGGRLRTLVAPRLDAYEIRRLVAVAACIAVAATANYAHSPLPDRASVAVGSAVLGILLVLRRRPRRSVRDELVPESDTVEAAVARLTIKGRRGSQEALQSLAASVSALERQLDAHEKRLTSLSGRQSLLQVEAREKYAEFDRSLTEIRGQHIELLRLLNAALAQHRQSLIDLSE